MGLQIKSINYEMKVKSSFDIKNGAYLSAKSDKRIKIGLTRMHILHLRDH